MSDDETDVSDGFRGEIGLSCGHWWYGAAGSFQEAEGFVAACVHFQDTVTCGLCRDTVTITGPLRPYAGICGSCGLGECSTHA